MSLVEGSKIFDKTRLFVLDKHFFSSIIYILCEAM